MKISNFLKIIKKNILLVKYIYNVGSKTEIISSNIGSSGGRGFDRAIGHF